MNRLKKRRDFLAAARGRKWATPGLVLQALAATNSSHETPRVGFTVTRKVGGAVTRNRARRRLKAVAANVIPSSGRAGYDYVVIGRGGTLTRAYPDLVEDLKVALARVHQPASRPRPTQPGRPKTEPSKPRRKKPSHG